MARSARYRILGHNLARLRKNHLGFDRKVAGNYTERQLSQAAAYTVFAHGEFESFLEDWASKILNRIAAKGAGPNMSSRMAHLMAYRPAHTLPSQIPVNNDWPTHCGAAIRLRTH